MDAWDVFENINITDIIPLTALGAIQDARRSNAQRGAASARLSGAGSAKIPKFQNRFLIANFRDKFRGPVAYKFSE